MSDKEIKNEENVSEPLKKDEEISSADKILQKIKDKKEANTIDEDIKEVETEIDNNITETPVTSTDNTEILNSEETENSKLKEIEEPEIEEKNETVAETIDYSQYSKKELLKNFNDILNQQDVLKNEDNIKEICKRFYTVIEEEELERKNKYIEDGGDEDSYEPVKDPADITLKELLKKFSGKKEAIEKQQREEKKKNLELKYAVIEDVKELINKPESFNKTFNKFRDLQKRWNSIGLVPKNDVKNLLDEYNKNVQKFYEYVEVNKELRELDFKKNFDIKIKLCELAEELLLETNYSVAKKELQELHKKWKETGPVSNESRDELWVRFQNATIKVNENYAIHIESIKEQQEKNLESKRFLVEKANEYASGEYINHLEWKDASNQVVQLQKLWKKIGYVPKEFNNEIYNLFKTACDMFFERIREFYDETEKHRDDNYQKKLDLCIQAESLQESSEWNKTTDIYKNIQVEWKKIGPVPKKHSDEIWKRFRKACNNFFNKKKEYFKDKKSSEKENLIKKEQIIEMIENLEFSDNQIENLKKLKELQNEFTSVGFVPYENKDEIYEKYHQATDSKFSKLDISKDKRDEFKFNENLEIIKNSPGAERIASNELLKIQSKIDKLNDDIKVWENNIGFFANSEKSESLIKNINDKIESAKSKVAILKHNINELEKIVN